MKKDKLLAFFQKDKLNPLPQKSRSQATELDSGMLLSVKGGKQSGGPKPPVRVN